MSYESLEDLVQGNALRIGRVAVALRREVKEVARDIWQSMEGQLDGAGGQHRAQRMETAMKRLELEAEATEEQMEDEAITKVVLTKVVLTKVVLTKVILTMVVFTKVVLTKVAVILL